jgi:hypothetical protein
MFLFTYADAKTAAGIANQSIMLIAIQKSHTWAAQQASKDLGWNVWLLVERDIITYMAGKLSIGTSAWISAVKGLDCCKWLR